MKTYQKNDPLSVAKVGTWSFDLTSHKITWSPLTFEIHNVDPKNGAPDFALFKARIHPADLKQWQDVVDKCMVDGEHYSCVFRIVRGDGSILWINSNGQGHLDENGKVLSLFGTCQDVTALKVTEIKLSQQKGFFKDTVDKLPAVFYAKGIDGRFISINKAFRDLFNWTEEQILGKTDHDLFPIELADQFRENDLEIIKLDKEIESEEVAIDARGVRRIYHSYKFPYHDLDGSVMGIGGISIDVTEKKVIAEKTFHNAKLASIGEMAAGVGHEINNPLAILVGYVDRVKKELNSTEFDREQTMAHLDKALEASRRITKIVTGLRNFSRVDSPEADLFKIKEAVEDSVSLVKEIYLSEGVEITFVSSKACDKVRVVGSRGKIQQVIMNLISNAKDATEGFKARRIDVVCSLNDSNDFIAKVIDNGRGISPKIQNRIFDPFFTTKEINKGTGIGLSVAHSVAVEHNGLIHFSNNLKSGATFKLVVPTIDGQLAAAKLNQQHVRSADRELPTSP